MAKEISEVTRLKIALVPSVLSLICIIPSMMLFSAGFYIQVAVQTKIRLIEGLDVSVLPGCIIAVGFLCTIYNSLSGALVFLSRRKKKREDLTRYLFPIVITGLVLFLAIFILGLTCFMQIHHLSNSFQKGITSAMRKYKSDMHMKEEIDVLQINYQCCGSMKYTDWFNVTWINEDYLSGDKVEKIEVARDSVPFSCCDPASVRPCIHQHVHDNDYHYRYDYRMALTLYKIGCRDALVSLYGHRLLINVGAVIVSISFLQIIAVVLTRIVQTSMLNALENDNPFGPAVGYIFFYENVGRDDTTMDPMIDPNSLDDGCFTDSTFDDVSDDERELLIANEPVNVGAIKNNPTPRPVDRTSRPVYKSSEHIYDDIYEIPHCPTVKPGPPDPVMTPGGPPSPSIKPGGPPPPSSMNPGGAGGPPPLSTFQAEPAKPPSIPQFSAPAPPTMLSPSPRLIPSVNKL